jgi:PKD repeat protein
LVVVWLVIALGAFNCYANALTDSFGNTISQDVITSGGSIMTQGGFTMDGAVGEVTGSRSSLPDLHLLFHGIPGPLWAAPLPHASFSGTPTSGNAPLTIHFTDESTSETGIASWYWDFGDGEYDTAQNPVHEYQAPGIYTVSLTVISIGGNDDTYTSTDYITVTLGMPLLDIAGLSLLMAWFLTSGAVLVRRR